MATKQSSNAYMLVYVRKSALKEVCLWSILSKTLVDNYGNTIDSFINLDQDLFTRCLKISGKLRPLFKLE